MERSSIAITFALLAACSTPDAVRDGAKATSDSLGVVQRELGQFAERSRANAAQKSDRIRRIQLSNAERQDRLNENVALYTAIGVGKGEEGQWVPVYQGLKKATEGYAATEAKRQAADEALAKALADAYTVPAPPAQTLADAAARYAKLAQPDSIGTQMAFIQRYGQCTAFGIQLERAQQAKKKEEELPKKPDFCTDFEKSATQSSGQQGN
jgi:hypothetical protein